MQIKKPCTEVQGLEFARDKGFVLTLYRILSCKRSFRHDIRLLPPFGDRTYRDYCIISYTTYSCQVKGMWLKNENDIKTGQKALLFAPQSGLPRKISHQSKNMEVVINLGNWGPRQNTGRVDRQEDRDYIKFIECRSSNYLNWVKRRILLFQEISYLSSFV